MLNEPSIDISRRMLAKLTRERRADPHDDETVQLQSEPVKNRVRVHRRYGWSDDETQTEI